MAGIIFYIGRVMRSSAVFGFGDLLSDAPLSSSISILLATDGDDGAGEDETASRAFEGCESNACPSTGGCSVTCDRSGSMPWCLASGAFLRLTMSGATRNAIRIAMAPYARDSIV